MCGRFALYAPAPVIAEIFGLDLPDLPEIEPRYNLAPTDPVLGIRDFSGGRVAEAFRWGLVPWWADDLRVGARMINARSESAATSKAFKDPMAFRRCVVVASGFYEWRAEGGVKQPWFYRRPDGGPLALAGLWDRWRKGGEEVRSCTILTTDASDVVRPVHDRMPVVLRRQDLDAWLDPEQHDPGAVRPLLRPSEDLVAYRVSTAVNSVRNDGRHLVDPLEED